MHILGKVTRRLGYRLDPILVGFEVAENLETQLTSAIGTKASFHNFLIQIAEA